MKEYYTLHELKRKLPEPFPQEYLGVRRFVKKHWKELRPLTIGEKGKTNYRYYIPKKNLDDFLTKFNQNGKTK
jgi:hypothetical protein